MDNKVSRFDGITPGDPKIAYRLVLLKKAEELGATTTSGLMYLDDRQLEDWVEQRLSNSIGKSTSTPILLKRRQQMPIPEELISDAAKAVEEFGEDELERFAEEKKKKGPINIFNVLEG